MATIFNSSIILGAEEERKKEADASSALLSAIDTGDISAVTALLDKGIDVETSLHRQPPLWHAARAREGSDEIINLLVARKANVNASGGSKKQFPLMTASFRGFDSTVDVLLKHKANVNQQDVAGKTALFMACYAGHVSAARTLLQAGAKVDLPDHEGDTPLMVAAYSNKKELPTLLIAYGADCSRKNSKGADATYRPLRNMLKGKETGDIIKILHFSQLRKEPRYPIAFVINASLTSGENKGILTLEYKNTITEEDAKKISLAIETERALRVTEQEKALKASKS